MAYSYPVDPRDIHRDPRDLQRDPHRYSDFSNGDSSAEEDTEEASEGETADHEASGMVMGSSARREFTEMKEQMYQDKLAELKRQLGQLQEGSLPEYVKRLRRLESVYRERIRVNEIIRELEAEMVEQDFKNEKRSSAREFEEHKVYLKDQLLSELEEKQKIIETERHNMELTGDSMELKTISTRKLRRRANEPSSAGGYGPGDKRRKPLQLTSLTYVLDDSDIIDDLKIINKNKAFSLQKPAASNSQNGNSSSSSGVASSPSSYQCDIRVEDGKLFYQKRWFRRGQAVLVEPKNGDKYPAMISAIGTDAIWVRKSADNAKARIYITQLSKGKIVIKRRAA